MRLVGRVERVYKRVHDCFASGATEQPSFAIVF